MIKQNIKKNTGFVILFAVTLSAILLSIALGIGNIALKEIKFNISEKDSNEALFAADVGIECALFNDKTEGGKFITPSSPSLECNNNMDNIKVDENSTNYWSFVISGLGNNGQNCAKVVVDKRVPLVTTIISKGYNKGDALCDAMIDSNRVERELRVQY